ncbi:hypothetical protein K438DRAFT_1776234 [Mycena galopus ATCC 62051]|nr:hypothetical protein K438DRAFT_1776234 [Mycena galopus ATCC 62051]
MSSCNRQRDSQIASHSLTSDLYRKQRLRPQAPSPFIIMRLLFLTSAVLVPAAQMQRTCVAFARESKEKAMKAWESTGDLARLCSARKPRRPLDAQVDSRRLKN